MAFNGKLVRVVQRSACAGVLLAAVTISAAAEPALIASNVRLRQGPGLNFGITTTIPKGTIVEVNNCTEWCNIEWGSLRGYVIGTSLNRGAPTIVGGPSRVLVVEPPPVVVGPPVYVGPRYYWGPGYYGRGWRRW
jgi:uncharacterized protein YraI